MRKDKKGLSFILLMIIIAAMALVLRVAIEQIIKINIAQNEASASSNLKLVSTALENYAKDHQGTYPKRLAELIQARPAYLNKDYLSYTSLKGYVYACLRLERASYNCSANPSICHLSGNKVFTITTGGILTSEECGKKE